MSFVVSERYDRLLLKPDDLYYRMICVDDLYRVLHDWFDFAITVSNKEIAEMLRDAFWNGSISRDDIIAIDDGIGDRAGHLAVLEPLVYPNQNNVENAARRAEIIGRASGVAACAFAVAYYQWPDEMNDLARRLGVTLIRYQAPDYIDLTSR